MHDPLRYNPGIYNPAPWQFRYAPKVRDVEHDLKDDPNDNYGQKRFDAPMQGPGGHIPDRTGPHGRGAGPGRGQGDGTGLRRTGNVRYNAWIPETKIGGMSFGWLGTIAVGSVGMVIGWLFAGYMEKR